jgi:hypothetical protein
MNEKAATWARSIGDVQATPVGREARRRRARADIFRILASLPPADQAELLDELRRPLTEVSRAIALSASDTADIDRLLRDAGIDLTC